MGPRAVGCKGTFVGELHFSAEHAPELGLGPPCWVSCTLGYYEGKARHIDKSTEAFPVFMTHRHNTQVKSSSWNQLSAVLVFYCYRTNFLKCSNLGTDFCVPMLIAVLFTTDKGANNLYVQ